MGFEWCRDPAWAAVDQREVRLVHLARAELLRQAAVRFIVFRHHHQPAGRPVQPMDNARTQFAPMAESVPK